MLIRKNFFIILIVLLVFAIPAVSAQDPGNATQIVDNSNMYVNDHSSILKVNAEDGGVKQVY